MKKIDIFSFYSYGQVLQGLRGIRAGQLSIDEQGSIYHMENVLEELIATEVRDKIGFRLCITAAKSLLDNIKETHARIVWKEPCGEVEQHELDFALRILGEFETLFRQECADLATFYVSRKRNYSTQCIIESADNEFPDAIKKRLPTQAVTDIRNAGRAFAFELGTASGIHSFRALESVVKEYLIKLKLVPKPNDLFTYLDTLEKNGADKKVIQIFQQLRRLRRNPLAHPEDNLDVDEAIEVFQLCTTAIIALVKDMEKRGLFS